MSALTNRVVPAVLTRIKPKLTDISHSDRTALIRELNEVAGLAHAFSKQRPKSTKNWQEIADSLDNEGVGVWNASGILRQNSDTGSRALFAALRAAGFRLIEAGLETKPGVETLAHALQLASKAGAALSEVGNNDAAASILGSAAVFEETLRSADDPGGAHEQARARATINYFTCRMEAAWREGNDGVAHFMLQKITETDHQRFALVLPQDREEVAAKVMQIGRSYLKVPESERALGITAKRAQEAVRWLQKAFSLVEHIDVAATPGLAELKRSVLRSLARAYYHSSSQDPENLTRAEATLRELLASVNESPQTGKPEYQQLRWMRIAVLKRRKAPDSLLLDAFYDVIDHMSYTDEDVADVLQDLRTLNQQHDLVTSATGHLIRRALAAPDDAGAAFVGKLLLSFIYHVSKGTDHKQALVELSNVLTSIVETGFDLPKVPAAACLTLLWQRGERHYLAKAYSPAADWYLIGTHEVFQSIGTPAVTKCYRKAALCHIHLKEFSRASEVVRRCPLNEAATNYIVFLGAAYQGLEDEAIDAVERMVNAPDFDRKMLLLATKLAHESDMSALLLSVLEALIATLEAKEGFQSAVEVITLSRCCIRLIMRLLDEHKLQAPPLVQRLLRHIGTALRLVEETREKEGIAAIAKEVSWLWRTAYNCAVEGCSERPEYGNSVPELFDFARQLLEVYCAHMIDAHPDLYVHIIQASFCATAARVFALREEFAANECPTDRLRETFSDVTACKTRVEVILKSGKLSTDEYTGRARSFVHLLRVFQVEMSSRLQAWDDVLNTIQELTQADQDVGRTYEAIADILWAEKDCPSGVLYTALEGLLHASLDRNSITVDKFSRWLRAICTILLAKGQPAERIRAVGYMDQAIAVLQEIQENGGAEANEYPQDERLWLLSTAYNTGIECLYASLLDEAKRWFELSTVMCRYVPDGPQRAEKISDTYTKLLSQFTV
ncbi:hypothetical protein PUNSTDRAFT_139817 [Punctularia strigosozonata HHB-11173 SS5]|uniref:uncharacterized protein n=1 Tax=Punctularia strigosozonata (strain HHB-11173) TaxID=741275 RepID=UPI0004416F50|nr:uncharacterized protein PUNSTDRAFT_139817 [Punctularia strigosozonata HHB-11173 SS5]EIN13175.1 hypothetical protein PUNSTDRAFT_139817 [Punctularia strigosozonata HHB-11173 SS5]